MRMFQLCLCLTLAAGSVAAQERIAAPEAVADSGLLDYLLPRFSLKTGVRVRPGDGGMVLAAEPPGEPVFRGNGVTYHLRIDDSPDQERFRDWLVSDIGKNTIESFQVEGIAPYSASVEVADVEAEPVFEGDAAEGEDLSMVHCGRCHVVSDANRNKSIGSTPSFGVLRAMEDWDIRFQTFYVLAPHGAFTQVEDVTEPFDIERPPPIVPITLTLDEIDAILAYVAAIPAADLGGPLQLQ